MTSDCMLSPRLMLVFVASLLGSSLPAFAQDAYVEAGSIRGQVHIVFGGYDLPLKQVPVYLLQTGGSFSTAFASLKKQVLPLLNKKALLTVGSQDWIDVSEQVIAIEKQRVVLFRRHTVRTVYADNQGLFVFHDVLPGDYAVFVEGAVKDKMTIWKAAVILKQGQHVRMDFGSHNVGDTKEVYR